MIFSALLVAISNFILCLVDNILGTQIFVRPLICSTVTGLVLGDLQTGLVMGAALEGIYMGFSAIGGTIPADPNAGSIVAVSYAILTQADIETALALSLPIATAMNVIFLFLMSFSSLLEPLFSKLVSQGKIREFNILHWLCNALVLTLPIYIVIFIGIGVGVQYLDGFLMALPPFILNGLGAAGGILPAIGFSFLLNMIWSNDIGIFFFMGFVACKFLSLPTIPLVIVALTFAIMYFYLQPKQTEEVEYE